MPTSIIISPSGLLRQMGVLNINIKLDSYCQNCEAYWQRLKFRMVTKDIVPHFLRVPNLRFGVWFADGFGTHLDIKLSEEQHR